jgi:hypothetical protein
LPAAEKHSLGLQLRIRPLSRDIIYVEGAAFTGSSLSSSNYRDNRLDPNLAQANRTQESPWFAGVGSHWRRLSVRLQHFQHRMPKQRKLLGTGGSLELGQPFWQEHLELRLGTEYYQLIELQDAGPLEETLAQTAFADFRVFFLRVGHRASSGQGRFLSPSLDVGLPALKEGISFLEFQYPSFLKLRYEQITLDQETRLIEDGLARVIFSATF